MRSDNPPAQDVRLFREIAETLYGPHPADLLADALGVNIRTVQRWLAGQNSVPDHAWDNLRNFMMMKGFRLEILLERINGDA